MTFRYIGSKARVVKQIAEYLGGNSGGFFVDVFCGTGAVAEAAAELGWPVRLNDHLKSATTIAAARLLAAQEVKFEKLGGYKAAIGALNEAAALQGFIWREYSPASAAGAGLERRYFTEDNAARIDGIRHQISAWKKDHLISKQESILLIGDLLSAVNRVANIAGTYGCFLSKWMPQAFERLLLQPRRLKPAPTRLEITNRDACKVQSEWDDLAYLDPPYTKRQYASYYHILETVTLGDEPTVEGVAGLRPWKELASDFCYKTRALGALCHLIEKLSARRILLSYSNDGHINLEELLTRLSPLGRVESHMLASIGRYRPNQQASATRSSVKEFLIVVEKSSESHTPHGLEMALR